MNNEEKNVLLKKFLIDISNDLSLENIDRYVNVLNSIYDNDFRHEYSTITGVLFLIEDIEARDILPEKIKYIEEKIADEDIKIKIDKLWDHINLENIRLAELKKISIEANRAVRSVQKRYNKLEKEYVEAQNKWNSINESALNARDNLEQVEKKINDSTTQSITILSIFAGVVMAFTGGMSYISQALASLNQIGPYRAGIFILLIGTVMFDLIFLLLYMIGKLTDRYIGSATCRCKNPKKGCSNRKMNCCIKRYPYIIWFNLVSLIIITSIVIVKFLDKYDLFVHRFIDIITAFAWYKLCQDFCITACVVSIYILFGYVINEIRKIECDNNEQ